MRTNAPSRQCQSEGFVVQCKDVIDRQAGYLVGQ